MSGEPELRIELCSRPPENLRVGGGNAFFVRGSCAADRPIRSLALSRQSGPTLAVQSARAAERGQVEWWATVPVEPVTEARTERLILAAELEEGSARAPLGPIRLEPGLAAAGESRGPDGKQLVAIAMATCNPPIELFERQIESIRDQRMDDWVCVISDDGSDPGNLEAMRAALGRDDRFRLHLHEERVGSYLNFERALRLIELEAPGAVHVALADQDDQWEPDKLTTLIDALGPRDLLAYSDLRIVEAGGEVLSDTFWVHRANNWTDLGMLLVGNTVTGSASLFRRELLDEALPFPPPLERSHHDHWLASVALALGELAYVDRPLQDYVQHPGAVIGFTGSNAGLPPAAALSVPARLGRLASRARRPEARRRYFEDYCRIALAARVLAIRCGDRIEPRKRRDVARMVAADTSLPAAASLLQLSIRSLARGNPTMGVDRSLLAGLAWRRMAARGAAS